MEIINDGMNLIGTKEALESYFKTNIKNEMESDLYAALNLAKDVFEILVCEKWNNAGEDDLVIINYDNNFGEYIITGYYKKEEI